jgi:hypothetical protein
MVGLFRLNHLNNKCGRRELAPSCFYRRIQVGHSLAAASHHYHGAALFLAVRSALAPFNSLNIKCGRRELNPHEVAPTAP